MFIRSVLIVCALTLTACTEHKPSASWEVASVGLYTGALSDDAQLVAVGSLNHGASMWRVNDRERMFNWSHEAGEYADLVAADFSPDSSRAVTTDPRTLVLWNTENGQALNFWATPSSVHDVAVLNDNRHVLMGMDDHSALLFDAQSGAYERTFLHKGVVGAVAVDRQGEKAVTGSDDNFAVLWSLQDGREIHRFAHDNPVRAVAISDDAAYTFTAAQADLVAIWDNTTGQILHELHSGMNHGVVTARFSADGQYLAVGYTSREIALYQVATGTRVQSWDPGVRHTMRRRGAAIIELAFADNNTLYALSGDGRLLQLRRT